jgi:hypothetical protein
MTRCNILQILNTIVCICIIGIVGGIISLAILTKIYTKEELGENHYDLIPFIAVISFICIILISVAVYGLYIKFNQISERLAEQGITPEDGYTDLEMSETAVPTNSPDSPTLPTFTVS